MSKLRVVIITQGVSRVVNPLVDSGINIVGIIECASRSKINNSLKYRLFKFIKSVITNRLMLHGYCHQKKIPYYFMSTSDDMDLENWLSSLAPDVMVVYSMSQLLKRNIYEIPRFGTINLHPAYLPDYRGPNPCFWQYYNLELKPGVTVHYIDDGEDTGDIVLQERLEIPLGIKSPERLDKLIKLGVQLIIKALDKIENNNAPRIKQPRSSMTIRARNLKNEEHSTIIDWNNWSIEHVWHVLRGTELWLNALPQPKGVYRGQRWVVCNYEIATMEGYVVGQIYRQKGEYFVSCRDGKIYLKVEFKLKQCLRNFILG